MQIDHTYKGQFPLQKSFCDEGKKKVHSRARRARCGLAVFRERIKKKRFLVDRQVAAAVNEKGREGTRGSSRTKESRRPTFRQRDSQRSATRQPAPLSCESMILAVNHALCYVTAKASLSVRIHRSTLRSAVHPNSNLAQSKLRK